MKVEEWNILAKALKTAYQNQNFLADQYAIKLWYSLLKDLDYKAVNTACQQYMLKEHFPPAIADIRKLATEAVTEPVSDWSEGYEQMMLAIRRYGYMQEEAALNSLPEVARETTKRIGWMTICTSNLDDMTAIRANFRQIYQSIEAQHKHNAIVPAHLRIQAEQVRQQALPVKEEPLLEAKAFDTEPVRIQDREELEKKLRDLKARLSING